MALIKCPECGKDVSDTIENCIHCGYKLKQNDSTKTTIIKCAKCGKENHNTNNFCNYCGSYLSKDINTTEVTEGKIDGNLLSQDNKNETPSQDNNPIDSKTTISNKLIIDVVNELPPFVKFIIAILGTIVALLLISLVFSSLIKCSYCTDGFIPCENCTDGKITCETCEGNMTVECKNCNDEFKTKCADCNGSGDGEKYTVKCYTCGGNGKVQLDCNNCHGMGWVYAGLTPTSCMHCNGTGKGETPDCPLCKNGISTRYKDCSSCSGTGYGTEDCTKCNKTKKVECENCSGAGLISCTECHGTGNIACSNCNSSYTYTSATTSSVH